MRYQALANEMTEERVCAPVIGGMASLAHHEGVPYGAEPTQTCLRSLSKRPPSGKQARDEDDRQRESDQDSPPETHRAGTEKQQ